MRWESIKQERGGKDQQDIQNQAELSSDPYEKVICMRYQYLSKMKKASFDGCGIV